jgi:hypothetical protein
MDVPITEEGAKEIHTALVSENVKSVNVRVHDRKYHVVRKGVV